MPEFADFIRRVERRVELVPSGSNSAVSVAPSAVFTVDNSCATPVATTATTCAAAVIQRPTFTLDMYHGRLNPATGATDIDGNEVDDWGFEGPGLVGVTGMHVTYGTMSICFVDDAAAYVARSITGWEYSNDYNQLEPMMVDSCLRIWNGERQRYEFFGDWGLDL